MDEPTVPAATAETEPTLDLEFPADLDDRPGEPAPPPSLPPAEPLAPAAPVETAKPVAPLAPTVAPDTGTVFDAIEEARRNFDAENRRRMAPAPQEPVDYNSLADPRGEGVLDLNAVAKQMRTEIAGAVEGARGEIIKTRVMFSERYMRAQHEDYDHVLADSGLAAAIQFDPERKQYADPFLAGMIFSAEDPALVAYTYAKGKLAKRTEGEATVRGREEGRREMVAQVTRNAERPKSIATLPAGSSQRTGFTIADIGTMSDERKAWIKKHRPDIWQHYLGG